MVDKQEDEPVWMPDLYKYSSGSLYTYRCGYTSINAFFIYEAGKVFRSDGNLALNRPRIQGTPYNPKITSLILTAQTYAHKEWRKKILEEGYRQYDVFPDLTEVEWFQLYGTQRHWPSLYKSLHKTECKERVCDLENPWYAQFRSSGEKITVWQRLGNIYMYDQKCYKIQYSSEVQRQMSSLLSLVYFQLTGQDEIPTSFEFGLDFIATTPVESFDFFAFFTRKKTKEEKEESLAEREARKLEKYKQARENKVKPDTDIFYWYDIMEYGIKGEDNTIISFALPAWQRIRLMNNIYNFIQTHDLAEQFDRIKLLPTKKLCSVEDVYAYQNEAMGNGYEGLLMKRPNFCYVNDYHLKNCDQVQYIFDVVHEFDVMGWKLDANGSVVWSLRDAYYKYVLFDCLQFGDREFQENVTKVADKFVGRKLTPKFMNRDANGVPYEPRNEVFDLASVVFEEVVVVHVASNVEANDVKSKKTHKKSKQGKKIV
jgi:hypothetical protein